MSSQLDRLLANLMDPDKASVSFTLEGKRVNIFLPKADVDKMQIDRFGNLVQDKQGRVMMKDNE